MRRSEVHTPESHSSRYVTFTFLDNKRTCIILHFPVSKDIYKDTECEEVPAACFKVGPCPSGLSRAGVWPTFACPKALQSYCNRSEHRWHSPCGWKPQYRILSGLQAIPFCVAVCPSLVAPPKKTVQLPGTLILVVRKPD